MTVLGRLPHPKILSPKFHGGYFDSGHRTVAAKKDTGLPKTKKNNGSFVATNKANKLQIPKKNTSVKASLLFICKTSDF